MKHIVVTKFNLPIAGRNNQHLDPEWLEHRFGLFEKWALPSMLNQTVKPDKWLIFMDKRTQPEYRGRMVSTIGCFNKTILPIYLEGSWEAMESAWFYAVKEFSEPGLVHTTRIDSDDAIVHDYILQVQNNYKVGHFTCFLYGYMCYENKAYKREYPKNPFLTYTEEVKDIKDLKTVNHVPHPKASPMNYITDMPGWIQQVHDKNLCNHKTIDTSIPTVPLDSVRKDFGI